MQDAVIVNAGAGAERVLLLHGLWMRRPAMLLLARRLRRAGFAVRLFPYATLWARPEASLRRLHRWMRDAGPESVHLVGHSLGGVTALAMLAESAQRGETDLPRGRVVCLGSPIAGSRAAAALVQRGLGVLVGRSATLLKSGVEVPADREVGMIAGTRGAGLGRWMARLDGPHDGSVRVSETERPGLADHICIAASHSGLLVSAEAARQCIAFLRDGRFERD